MRSFASPIFLIGVWGWVGGVHCGARPQAQIGRTKGRSSADRKTKPTLMLTEPRSIFKSSTKDSSLSTFEIVFQRHNCSNREQK